MFAGLLSFMLENIAMEGSIETSTHDIEWLFPRNLYVRWVNMNELIYTPEQLEEKYNK